MNKKYRVAIAFMVTLLLVLGSVPMAFADDKQTSIHVHNATGETITAVKVYYTDNTSVDLIDNPSGTKWDALDQGERVRDQIAKIEITFQTSGLNTYYYPDDFGPQGGHEEPIEYSAEGAGSGSINLWVTKIFNLTPEIISKKQSHLTW